MPPAGFEPAHTAPEADALSPELRGRGLREAISESILRRAEVVRRGLKNSLGIPRPERFPGPVSESTIDRAESLVVDGVQIGRYRLRDLPRTAEFFEADAPVTHAAHAVLGAMAGWSLTTTDAGLVERLLAGGAVTTRRYALMSLALDAAPAALDHELPFTTVRLTRLTEVTPSLIDLVRNAYPEGHPDEELGTDADVERDLRRILDGEWLGPLDPASRVLLDGGVGGRPVAMIIVNRPEGRAPVGGLWLSEICRAPEEAYRGLGADLLRVVVHECRVAGEEALSLAVTDGNPARRLYEKLGFVTAMSVTKLSLPG